MLFTMFKIRKTPNRLFDYAEDVVIETNGKSTFFHAIDNIVSIEGKDYLQINAFTIDEDGKIVYSDISSYGIVKNPFTQNLGKFKQHIQKFCIEYMQNVLENELKELFEDDGLH